MIDDARNHEREDIFSLCYQAGTFTIRRQEIS
jgi:hypothetical protein